MESPNFVVGMPIRVSISTYRFAAGLSKDIPGYVKDLRKSKTFRKYDDKYDISKKINKQAAKLPSKLGSAASTLQDITVGVFGALVKLVTVLTMTFFLLLDGGRILGFLLRKALLGRKLLVLLEVAPLAVAA